MSTLLRGVTLPDGTHTDLAIVDGAITEITVYCTGDWDRARVAEHASAVRRGINLQRRSSLAGEAAAASAEVEAALTLPPDQRAAAFFDVDNTIIQGASIFHLARGLYRRDFFTTRDLLGAAWKQAYFRLVGVEDPEHVAEARNSALSFIAGHTVAELEELGEEIFDEGMAAKIWPGTRALAQMHAFFAEVFAAK